MDNGDEGKAVFKITFIHDLGESYQLVNKYNQNNAEEHANWIASERQNCKVQQNCKVKSVEQLSIAQQIQYLKDIYQGEKFMDTPDEWYEPCYWWCENSHRSKRYLKSEKKGYDACLVCGEPVMLGPKKLFGRVPL
jgi:hypothetical protein